MGIPTLLVLQIRHYFSLSRRLERRLSELEKHLVSEVGGTLSMEKW